MDYRHVFYAFNGAGPWLCTFCDNDVQPHWDGDGPERRSADALVVHHQDHNKQNNTPDNLKAAHQSCHARHHQRGVHVGVVRSEETRRKLSIALTGKTYRKRTHEERQVIAEQTRARMAAMTDEEKAEFYQRISASTDRTLTLCECGAGPFKGQQGVSIHKTRSGCELIRLH